MFSLRMLSWGMIRGLCFRMQSPVPTSQWATAKFYSRDSRDDLVSLAQDFNDKVQRVSSKLSTSDAGALVKLVGALSDATLSLALPEDATSSYNKLLVEMPPAESGVVFPVYLDTKDMTMCYGPMTYFPEANPLFNISTQWQFEIISNSLNILRNHVTPVAWVQLVQEVGANWQNICISESQPPLLIVKKFDGTGMFEMYTIIGGGIYYFVPIAAVQGQAENSSRKIVAAMKSDLTDKDNTFIWSEDPVPE